MIETCSYCETNERAKMKTCARCRVARYCSADCQRADWPRHKPGCTAPGTREPDFTRAPANAAIDGRPLEFRLRRGRTMRVAVGGAIDVPLSALHPDELLFVPTGPNLKASGAFGCIGVTPVMYTPGKLLYEWREITSRAHGADAWRDAVCDVRRWEKRLPKLMAQFSADTPNPSADVQYTNMCTALMQAVMLQWHLHPTLPRYLMRGDALTDELLLIGQSIELVRITQLC